jgi:hypothetical protein
MKTDKEFFKGDMARKCSIDPFRRMDGRQEKEWDVW